jgi:hypothetical protein
LQTRFLTWFNKLTSTPQVPIVLKYYTLLPIQMKDTMPLMNPHEAITPLENVPSSRFFSLVTIPHQCQEFIQTLKYLQL